MPPGESDAVAPEPALGPGRSSLADMGAVREQLNIGQLCRERFGSEAALIGFGTHTGTVAAATDWDGALEVKRVRPSQRDSYEWLCQDAGLACFLLDLGRDEALRRRLLEPRLQRFIGVIYRPDTELMSHYSDASLPQQEDGDSRDLSVRVVIAVLRRPASLHRLFCCYLSSTKKLIFPLTRNIVI